MTTTTATPDALTFIDLVTDTVRGSHLGHTAPDLRDGLYDAMQETNSDPVVTDHHGFVPEPVARVIDGDEMRFSFEDGSSLVFLFDEDGYSYALSAFDATEALVGEF